MARKYQKKSYQKRQQRPPHPPKQRYSPQYEQEEQGYYVQKPPVLRGPPAPRGGHHYPRAAIEYGPRGGGGRGALRYMKPRHHYQAHDSGYFDIPESPDLYRSKSGQNKYNQRPSYQKKGGFVNERDYHDQQYRRPKKYGQYNKRPPKEGRGGRYSQGKAFKMRDAPLLEYMSQDEVRILEKQGRVVVAPIEMLLRIPYLGKLKLADGISISVKGRDMLNRSMDKDLVAVQILPPSKWHYPAKKLQQPQEIVQTENQDNEEDDDEEIEQVEQIQDIEQEPKNGEEKKEEQEPEDIEQDTQTKDEKASLPVIYKDPNSEFLRSYNSINKVFGTGASGKEESKEEKKNPKEKRNSSSDMDLDFALLNDWASRVVYIKNQEGFVRGKVVRVIKRRETPLLCTLHPSSSEHVVVARPVGDSKTWINLFKKEIPRQYRDDFSQGRDPSHRYYMVKVKDWKIQDHRPAGTVLQQIGLSGNLQHETVRLLKQYECHDDPYSEELEAQFEEGWQISEDERKLRRDLSENCIFTIDPLTARDLDDALSIQEVAPGIFEMGVHIADVSHFVPEGTPIDNEAIKRATSVYFVHQVVPMLPRRLCDNLCSLLPDRQRLCFSCYFRVTADGKMLDDFKPKFQKTIINSCAKWDYDLVQQILDGKVATAEDLAKNYPDKIPRKPFHFDTLKGKCFLMNKIAQARRAFRFDNGAVNIHQPEYSFKLDEENLPIEFKENLHSPSHELVEEFMLWANQCAAKRMLELFQPKALLRRHPALTDESIEKLQDQFKAYELPVDVSSTVALHKSMEMLRAENPDKYQVAMSAFFGVIKEAEYIAVDETEPKFWRHFGLNFDHYTHFTSPIRRYADLVVHRLLTAALYDSETPEVKKIQEYAGICSKKSANARKASRECMMYFHSLLLKRRIEEFKEGAVIEEALLTDLTPQKASFYIKSIGKQMSVFITEPGSGVEKARHFPALKKVLVLLGDPAHFKEALAAASKKNQSGGKVKFVKKGQDKHKAEKEFLKENYPIALPIPGEGKEVEQAHLEKVCKEMEAGYKDRLIVLEVLKNYNVELFIEKPVPLTLAIKLKH